MSAAKLPELVDVDIPTRQKVMALAGPIEAETGVSLHRMLGRERLARVVRARHMLFAAMWRGHFSYSEIASVLKVDHSTVSSALRKTVAPEEYKAIRDSRRRAS